MICPECGSGDSRATPLIDPEYCLKNHTQYICGSCGRCICIECDPKRGLRRWNFPFKTLPNAKLYLRTGDHCMKKCCGIYEIKSGNRVSYKIFPGADEVSEYLKRNKGKVCEGLSPVFTFGEYSEFEGTQVRRLTGTEAEKYLSEKSGRDIK